MTIVVGYRAHAWRFDDDVVNDSTSHKKVGEQDKSKDHHGWWLLEPAWSSKLQVGNLQDGERKRIQSFNGGHLASSWLKSTCDVKKMAAVRRLFSRPLVRAGALLRSTGIPGIVECYKILISDLTIMRPLVGLSLEVRSSICPNAKFLMPSIAGRVRFTSTSSATQGMLALQYNK